MSIRELIFEAIDENIRNLSITSILSSVESKLPLTRPIDLQEAVLTEFYDLFRTGYLSWGCDLCNSTAPFCHLTERGRKLLANLSRDPGNALGYLQHVKSSCELNDIADSYLIESVNSYVAGQFKASAVMIGAACEAIILELRDLVVKNKSPTIKGLNDWKMKSVLKGLSDFFEKEKTKFDQKLKEDFEAYWQSFTYQIRNVRNEAGHPSSIEPITEDSIHASLLIFPEIAKLAKELKAFLNNDVA